MVAVVSGNGLGLFNSSAGILGQQGVFGNCAGGKTKENGYVNVANGNFLLQDRDDFLAARGIDVALARTYNSQGSYSGGIGANWKIGLNKQLQPAGAGNAAGSTVTRIDGDGSASLYRFDAARNAYVSTDGGGAYQSITFNAQTKQWTWRADHNDLAGNWETYDGNAGARIATAGDATGQRLAYAYNANGQISELTNGSGERTLFHYNASGNLAQFGMALAGSGTEFVRVYYGYDAQNRLSTVVTDLTPKDSVLDANRYTTTYTYDGSSSRIAGISQDDGTRLAVTYQLAGADYKVATLTDAFGRKTSFDYSVAGKTGVTDPLGNKTIYGYDAKGQLTDVTAPAVNGVSQQNRFSYDGSGNLLSQVDAAGNTISFSYDANGNRILERDAAGNTVARSYDAASNVLLSETRYFVPDPDGSGPQQPGMPATTRFAYDAQHRLRFKVSAENRVTEYRINAQGQRGAAIDYNASLYNPGILGSGNVSEGAMATWAASVADRSRTSRIDYLYDARGLLASATSYASVDAAGEGVRTNQTHSTTTYVHDQAGQLLQAIDGKQHLTSYAYDGLGRLLGSTDPLGVRSLSAYTDRAGLPSQEVRTRDGSGAVTTVTFDAAGMVGSEQVVHDGMTSLTSYSYDANGNLLMRVNPAGKRHFWYYDAAGRKIAEVDESGAVTETIYNVKNQPTRVNRYVTSVASAALVDIMGRPLAFAAVTLRNGNGAGKLGDRDTLNAYDSAGRLADSVDGLGNITHYDYDGASRLVRVTRRATPMLIDPASRSFEALAVTQAASPGDRVTRSFYDQDGKLTGILDADGYLTRHVYDAGGRLVDTVVYANATSAMQRAAASLAELVPALDPLKDIHQRKLYNGKDQLIASIDGENYVTELAYDPAGNVSSRKRYAGAAGNPAGADLAALGLTLRPADDQLASYRYTDRNELFEETAADGSVTRYTYDAAGRLTLAQRALGSTEQRDSRYRYDELGHVAAELSAEGAALLAALAPGADSSAIWAAHAVRHTYDALGLRLTTTDQLGHRTLFYYDALGRQTHAVNAAGEVQAQTWNSFGQVSQSIQYATRFSAAQLASLVGGQATAAFLTLVNANAYDRIHTYTYDAAGRLTGEFDGTSGNAAEANRGGYLTELGYDAFGQLKSRKIQNTGLTAYLTSASYQYDQRGNLTRTLPFDNAALASAVQYDAFGRATRRTDANGTWRETAYDRVGRATATTVSGAIGPFETMTYDAFNRVAAHTDATGGVTKFTYATAQRSLTITTAEGVTHTTVKNRFGQTVSLSDNKGNTTTYSYDRNGALTTTGDGIGIAQANKYDRAGLLASSTDANGKLTSFTYDAANRILTRTVDPGGLNLATSYGYDAIGRAATVTDARGSITETLYDKTGQVRAVTVDKGGLNLVTAMTYDSRGNRLTVTDPAGRATTFTYSENSFDQAYVVGGGGASEAQRFDSGGRNLVLRIAGPSASAVTRYAYNASNQLAWEVDPEGAVTGYWYDKNQRLVKVTRFANPSKLVAGVPASTAIFSAAQIAASVSADGAHDATTLTVYDKDGRVYASVDPGGRVTINLRYDSEGRVTEQRSYAKALQAALPADPTPAQVDAAVAALADGAHDRQQRMVYDARGRVTATLSALPPWPFTGEARWSVQRQQYDGNGNVIARTGFASAFRLNYPSDAAIATWMADPVNHRSTDSDVRLAYDAANRLVGTATAVKGADGDGVREWAFVSQQYDANGNVMLRRAHTATALLADVSAARINEAANGAGQTADDAQTRFVYDKANRMVASATAQGPNAAGAVQWAVARQSYDGAGNVLARTEHANPLGADRLPAKPGAADYSNWILNSVVADPARDRMSRFTYDGANRLVLSADAANAVTQRSYDALGNLAMVTQFAKPGNPAVALAVPALDAANDRTTRTFYDREHRPLLQVDARGALTEYRYDALGNLTATIARATRLTATQLAALRSDARSGDVKVTPNPLDRIERTVFDKNGRARFVVDALGFSKQYDYDALGRVTRVIEFPNSAVFSDSTLEASVTAAAAQQITLARTRITGYNYDAQGNLVSTTDALKVSETYGYDALGRKMSFNNKLNAGWDYKYDAAGRLVSELAPEVTLDGGAAVRDPNTGKWSLALTATPKVRLETVIVYDALGNVSSRTEASGQANQRKVSYKYDAAGRQVETTLPPVAVYNEAELAAANGAAGEATRAEKPAVALTIRVTYDALGNAIANQDVAGKMSYKAYDQAGQVRYEVDADNYVTAYERDAFGQVTALTRFSERVAAPAASATDAAALAKLLKPADPKNRTVKTAYDQAGRTAKITEPGAYAFDQNTLQASAYFTAAKTTDFTYDAFGGAVRKSVYGANESGVQLSLAHDTYFSFDLRGSMLSEVDILQNFTGMHRGYVTAMEYDAAGQVTRKREFANWYDMTDAAVAAGVFALPTPDLVNDRETTYRYDNLGRKDLESRLQVGISSNGASSTATITTSFGYDALGNMTSSTDALGNETRTSYDVLGRVSAVAVMHAGAPASTLAPLTEFRRDAYGNVVQRIEYANGAAAGAGTVAMQPDRVRDRVTSNIFDLTGHVTQSIDAEGNANYSSYDAFGHVAKLWQRVTDVDGKVQTAFQVSHYDALGRVTSVDTPDVRNAINLGRTVALSTKTSEYNAFGEVVGRRIIDSETNSPYAYADYDNAGHLWRTNDGDGIDSVTLFDALGNATAQIRSTALVTGSNPLADRTFDSAANVVNQLNTLRTDTRYDLLGRVVDVRQQVDSKLYIMRRDFLGNWNRVEYPIGTGADDGQVVVGGPSDEGKTVTVRYRAAGSAAWLDAAGRLGRIDDYVVFSTAGLVKGGYEFQVFTQAVGEAALERQGGSFQISSAESAARNEQIARMYALVFDRAADSAGLSFWTTNANGGLTAAQILQSMIDSPEGKARLGGDSTAAIRKLFAAVGKDANEFEVGKWVTRYDRKTLAAGDNRGLAVAGLMEDTLAAPATPAAQTLVNRARAIASYLVDYRGGNSDTAASIYRDTGVDLAAALATAKRLGSLELQRTQVAQLYVTLFGRAPEPAAMAFWVDALTRISPAAMGDAMLDSAEARDLQLYPLTAADTLTPLTAAQYNQQLINRAYQTMLGRAPTAAELVDWTARFAGSAQAPAIGRGQFAVLLADKVASYAGADAALKAEKLLYNEKVAIGLTFAALARDATLPAGMDGAVGKAIIAAVTSGETAKLASERAIAALTLSLATATALETAVRAAAGATPMEQMRMQVSRLYVALLNRAPDKLGLAYYLAQTPNRPDKMAAVANALLTSPESTGDTSLCAVKLVNGVAVALTNAEFVERVYTLALGRLPASSTARAEMAAFTAQLATMSRATVAVNIVSGMLGAKDLSADDSALKATFANKAAVGLAFALDLPVNNAVAAREVLARVTATDIKAALDYAYAESQKAMAEAAAALKPAATSASAAVSAGSTAASAAAAAAAAATAAAAGMAAAPSAAVRLQLMQMYVGILGRTEASYRASSDLAGLNLYADAIASVPLPTVAQYFIDSAEGRAIYANTSDDAFVAKVYATVLARSSIAQPGAAAWALKLKAPAAMTRGQVALGILTEVLAYANVQPDAAAQAYLTAAAEFSQRVSAAFAVVETAAAAAAASAAGQIAGPTSELAALLASLTPLKSDMDAQAAARDTAVARERSEIVNAGKVGDLTARRRLDLNRLYATLLQRTAANLPRLDELDYYISRGISNEATANAMMSSPEAAALGGFPPATTAADKAALVNKLYTVILQRVPAGTEAAYWINQLDQGLSRGAVACNILTAYADQYSDNTADLLSKKALFDQKIDGFLAAQKQAALNESNLASAEATRLKGVTAAALAAIGTANTELSRLQGVAAAATAAAVDGDDVLRLAGVQQEVTKIFVSLRGHTDLGGLAFYMRLVASGANTANNVIADVLAGSSYPSDPAAFVQKLYNKVLLRNGSTGPGSEIEWWAKFVTSDPASRVMVASEILNSAEARGVQATPITNAMAADTAMARQLVAAKAAAIQNVGTAANALAGANAAYQGALLNEAAGASAAARAAGVSATASALAAAHLYVAKADAAYVLAVTAKATYDAAKARYDALKVVVDAASVTSRAFAAASLADHAGAVAAVARAGVAAAAVTVANSTIAEAALPAPARQARQITQLFVTLVKHRPAVSDLTFWMSKLNSGSTYPDLAIALINGPEAQAAGYTAAMSADAFVNQLYLSGLGRSADAGGLRFWSDQLGGTAPLTRPQLAAVWVDAVWRSGNSDTVLMANKIVPALQAVLAEAAAIGAAPDLTGLIAAADTEANAIALAYDASAAANAASALARNSAQLARLYLAVLNRAPDAAGMQFWADGMARSGLTAAQVAQSMIASPEGQALLPAAISNNEFVSRLFAKGIGRPASAAELAKYSAQLATLQRGNVAVNIVTDVLTSTGGNLLAQTTRMLFDARATAALGKSLLAAADNTRALDYALKSARLIAAANPVDRHTDYVPKGIDSTLVYGANTPPAAPANLLTLDRWGNTVKIADLRNPNWVTEYRYDANNQVTMVLKPLVADSASGTNKRPETLYGYDKLGRLESTRDANLNLNRIVYDANGNVMDELHADGGVVHSEYDVFGNRTAVTQGNGVRTDYGYDRLGQLATTTSATVRVYTARDTYGDMGTRDDGDKQLVDRYQYDQAGRRILSVNGAGETTTMRYDLAGNLMSVRNAIGQGTRIRYDSFHHKIAETDANGRTMVWELDSYGKTLSRSDYRDALATSLDAKVTYRYNGLNQVVQQSSTNRASFGAQNIYNTYENGLLTKIDDVATLTTTTYAYDLAGNRVLEKTVARDGATAQEVVVQNNRVRFDAAGRMASATDDRFDVKFSYDLNGNRTVVKTAYLGADGLMHDVLAYNQYDAMNRASISNGALVAGKVVIGSAGHEIKYDAAGYRVRDSYLYANARGVQTRTTEAFGYDAAGRLIAVTRSDSVVGDALLNGVVIDDRRYDAAGRLTESGAQYSSNLDRLKEFGVGADHRTYAYDSVGRLERMKMRDMQTHFLDDIYYRAIPEKTQDVGYDAAGNLVGYTVVPNTSGKNQTLYDNKYAYFGGYKEVSVTARRINPTTAAQTTTTQYDANGNVLKVTDSGAPNLARSYLTDAAGRVLRKTQDGVVTWTMVVNGEVFGSHSDKVATDGFANTYESGNSGANTAAPTIYNVQANGESLQAIAKAVWGDSKLWYLIADANGLGANPVLAAGTLLKIPARVNTVHGDYETFKPYHPGEAIGDTLPTLPMPAPSKKGGGLFGQILMLVAAIVITYITAGALAGPAMTALFGSGAGFATGAIAAAAGSIASQAVGIAIGAQEGFNWKGVALAAISGGVTGGVESAFNGAGMSGPLFGSEWTAVAGRAVISNVASQGIGIITGLQDGFNWRNVAASGVAAAIGNELAPGQGATRVEKLVGSTFSGIVSGTAAALVRGGRVDIQQIATDAFGNALGGSIADTMKPRPAYDDSPALAKLNLAVEDDLHRFDVDLRDQTRALIAGVKDVELVDPYFEALKKEFALPADIDDQITKRMLSEPNVADLTIGKRSPFWSLPSLPKVQLADITLASVSDPFKGDWSCKVPARPGSPEWYASATEAEKSAYAMAQPGPKLVPWDGVVRESPAVAYARRNGAYDPRSNTLEAQVGPTIRPFLMGVLPSGGFLLAAEGGYQVGQGYAQVQNGEALSGAANIGLGGLTILGGGAAAYSSNLRGAASGELRAAANPSAVGDGLAFRADLQKHMIGPDGFTKSGQLSGTHNLENATAALNARGATYTVNPTNTPGVSELQYAYTNPATGKMVSGNKTVYDPLVLSDNMMMSNAQQVGQRAWTQYLQNPSIKVFDGIQGGVNFRSYINFDKNGNAFIGNVHPIK